MLFAASGDSHRQLLFAGFLRYPPSWCLRAQEASLAQRGQPNVWGPTPIPAAALSVLCPASAISLTFPPNWSKASPKATSLPEPCQPPTPRPTHTHTHIPPVGWPPKATTFSSSGFPVFLLLFYCHQTPSFLNPSQLGVTSEISLIN